MKKFMVLYMSPVSAAEQMAVAASDPEAGMALWTAWAEKNKDAIVDLGAPLGDARRVPSGSSSGSGDHVTGFSVLQADTMDDAASRLEDHPHHKTPGGSSIEVFEYLEMPGMG